MSDIKLNHFQECVKSICDLHYEYIDNGKLSPMELIGAIAVASHITLNFIDRIQNGEDNE